MKFDTDMERLLGMAAKQLRVASKHEPNLDGPKS